MTTHQASFPKETVPSLAATRNGRALPRHDGVPHLHEGWLRIASVLQPLRRGAHTHARRGAWRSSLTQKEGV